MIRTDPDDGRACLHQVGRDPAPLATFRTVPAAHPLPPHCMQQASLSTVACAGGGRAAAQAKGGVHVVN